MLIFHLYILFSTIPFHGFLAVFSFNWTFFFLLLNFDSSFYTLNTSPQSNFWFAGVFSPVCNLSFYSFHIGFHREKFLILISSNFQLFLRDRDRAIGFKFKNSFSLRSQGFLLWFFLKVSEFYILHLWVSLYIYLMCFFSCLWMSGYSSTMCWKGILPSLLLSLH